MENQHSKCDSNESYKAQENVCAVRVLRIIVHFAGKVGGLRVIEVIEAYGAGASRLSATSSILRRKGAHICKI